MKEAIEFALSDPEVQQNPTYFIVMGDASAAGVYGSVSNENLYFNSYAILSPTID